MSIYFGTIKNNKLDIKKENENDPEIIEEMYYTEVCDDLKYLFIAFKNDVGDYHFNGGKMYVDIGKDSLIIDLNLDKNKDFACFFLVFDNLLHAFVVSLSLIEQLEQYEAPIEYRT